jgi:hypothetical protein
MSYSWEVIELRRRVDYLEGEVARLIQVVRGIEELVKKIYNERKAAEENEQA